ncbi:MAG: radical SAM protein [Candidatus Lokiarchaeota archaeon]|nr:radical SAM protein [Candidatus Lokiarchaeota archaeon]
MKKQYLGEIINHPLLGKILPVDFSPLKTCSFNCYYCSLGKTTNMTMQREDFYPVQDIIQEIDSYLTQNDYPDYLFLTGSGEPALYSKFGELARKIKERYPSIKLTAYSNASLLYDPEVRRDFYECDIMQFNLNSIIAEEFSRINQHHSQVKIGDVLDGLRKFKGEYTKPIWIHSIFGNKFNISEVNIKGLRKFIADFKPEKYIIRTFEKENDVEPLSDDTIKFIKSQMDSLNCECVYMGFD